MSKRVKLPGKKHYKAVTEYMRKKQVYTKTDLIEYLKKELGKSHAAATATAVVMLSPRLTSNRGDCRGNVSNPWGHIAYNEALPRKVDKETGKNEEKKFRFRFRKSAMSPHNRKDIGNTVRPEVERVEVKAKKTTKKSKSCKKVTA